MRPISAQFNAAARAGDSRPAGNILRNDSAAGKRFLPLRIMTPPGPARRGSMDVVGKTISNETENESSSVGHSPPHPAAKLTGALAALEAQRGSSSDNGCKTAFS